MRPAAPGRKHVFATPPMKPTLEDTVLQPMTAMEYDFRTVTIDHDPSLTKLPISSQSITLRIFLDTVVGGYNQTVRRKNINVPT